jgi:signal transduction histidine kinase/phage shock protein PspC (stress-responsive transcriptional regulator)
VTERPFELRRRKTNRILAGVAGGLADSLGVGDAFVRAAFVTVGAVWGLGGLVYVGLWLVTLDRVEDLEYEPVEPPRAIGLGLGFIGLMWLLEAVGWWPSNGLVLTIGALAFGTAALTDRSVPGPLAALVDPSVDQPGRMRMLLGVGLLVGGLALFASNVDPILDIGPVLLAVGLTGVGILIAFGPWVTRLAKDLGTERSERIRQEERAEMAAHLHDSVLQTLALIQRSDDPARAALLARHQEHELRDWLYGNAPLDGMDLLSTALRGAAARIEEDHQLPVDVVAVGDSTLDETNRALVGAASEAMVNAAKHSGADRVSLYFEAEQGGLVVYVTDHGKGFDPASIGDDRKGIADSIRGRMEKAGGTVAIESTPGEGTEVILRLAPSPR